jgi:LPS-assembly lipoprotein
LALSACGFTPLYGAPGVTPGLAAIETVASDGRAGFLLREQLDDALARDAGCPPAYKLTLCRSRAALRPRRSRRQRRQPLRAADDGALAPGDAKTNAEIRKGQAEAAVTYDSADQPYAAIAAQQDGQERAADRGGPQDPARPGHLAGGPRRPKSPAHDPVQAAGRRTLPEGPDPDIRAVVIYGKDRGVVRDRADQLAKRCSRAPTILSTPPS